MLRSGVRDAGRHPAATGGAPLKNQHRVGAFETHSDVIQYFDNYFDDF